MPNPINLDQSKSEPNVWESPKSPAGNAQVVPIVIDASKLRAKQKREPPHEAIIIDKLHIKCSNTPRKYILRPQLHIADNYLI